MTLIEVIDAARGLLNEPLDSTRTFPDNTSSFWTDGQLMTYHNLIQQECANKIIDVYEDYFVTQTTLSIVAGTAEYSLPSTFVKMRRVEDIRTSGTSLEIPPASLNNRSLPMFLNGSGSTYPGGYYLRGNQIVFENTPTFTNSSAIRLHFIHRISDVTAGNLSSELPVQHHRCLVWGVYRYCLIQQQSSQESLQMATLEYEKHVADMVRQAESRQVQQTRRVVRFQERTPL